ncbi:uncharacterized protein K02A2.6-like [Ornithodoros turicata]|uniref:uncharacterized protein K02A2.6-like n=1 Tax=Ornithodoros turicata TaxID=34597 RepID=UPI003139530A
MTWPSWKKAFQNYLVASGLDKESTTRRKAILYHCLGAEGQRIFDLLPPSQTSATNSVATTTESTESPSETAADEMEIALKTLDTHYTTTVNPIAERHKFRQRRQQLGESIYDYVLALRELASTCDFGATLDSMIRDQIVESTNIPHLRERLLLEGRTLTLARTIMLARQFQQSQKESREFAVESEHEEVQQVTRQPARKPMQKRQGDRSSKRSATRTQCFRCGSRDHLANSPSCKARNQRCSACGKMGHFRSVCRSLGQLRQLTDELPSQDSITNSEVQTTLQLDTSAAKKTGIYVTLSVSERDIRFLIDTGSSATIMSSAVYEGHFASLHPLKPTSVSLYDFSKRSIPIQGRFSAPVKYANRSACLNFYVVSNGTTLLGMDAVTSLELCIDGMSLSCFSTTASTVTVPPAISADFEHLFDGTLGLSKHYIHKVKIRSDIKPVTGKLRRLPLTVREQVSQELRRLEEQDVIENVTASEWVSPIVVVKKKDGSIRLCVDLREPNKAVIADCFPLPHTEELLNALAGAMKFSKLDLASAYQVPLHPDSRDLTAFITHEGLFRFKRAAKEFSSDDIIVYGHSQEEHDNNLRHVLKRLSAEGLKLNHKCVFDVVELTFLGHVVNAHGLLPQTSAIQALQRAPPPTDLKSLRSFLGLLGYYSKFIHHFAELVEPMRELLREGKTFEWTSRADQTFNKVKATLSSCPVLHMFDVQLPVVVTTDASSYGLGAVLQQIKGNEVRTVAFASRTLSSVERKYSVGEREALACMWACEHWHVYLWGRPFTLRTDHQALVTLLGTQGSGHRPLRISRWSARLLYYNFTIEYKKGAENYIADALSRLPLQSDDVDEEIVCTISSPISKEELQEATLLDPEISEVISALEQATWSRHAHRAPAMGPYHRCGRELSVVNGLLHRGERLVVPRTLTSRLLEMAHETHPGIVRTKQRLRDLYWWPGNDAQVEKMVHDCSICQSADKSAKVASAPLHPVVFPATPWSKMGMDIVGPFEDSPPSCRYAITLLDYHSKWPEISFAPAVTTSTVEAFLMHVFSREGYPEEKVTDNGPQFVSTHFKAFLRERGIQHTTVSVYYPQANGQVERFNRVLKDTIQVAILQRKDIKRAILEHLAVYRSTPHATTGVSPAVLLHGRNFRTRVNVVGLQKPSATPDMSRVKARVSSKQSKQKVYTDDKRSARFRKFMPGDYVRVRLPGRRKKGRPNFSTPLRIIASRGPLSFLLEDGRIWHSSKFTPFYGELRPPEGQVQPDVPPPFGYSWWPIDDNAPVSDSAYVSPQDQAPHKAARVHPLPSLEQQDPPLRRSTRQRSAPVRYPANENDAPQDIADDRAH